MLKNICSKSAPVRQASVYGVGVMAQCAAEHFAPACLGALGGRGTGDGGRGRGGGRGGGDFTGKVFGLLSLATTNGIMS